MRLAWLEREVSAVHGINVHSIITGTPLQSLLTSSASTAASQTTSSDRQALKSTTMTAVSGPTDQLGPSEGRDNAQAPELSMLTLNATGETRYLGPSSGLFFATFAASLAKSPQPAMGVNDNDSRRFRHQANQPSNNQALTADVIQLLACSFTLWILPIYPLVCAKDLEDLVTRCKHIESGDAADARLDVYEVMTFYLIMALGAVNVKNTLNERPDIPGRNTVLPAADDLRNKAVNLFQKTPRGSPPSLPLIRVLLLMCIYSSYGANGLSQWQLAGLAMRVSTEHI